jgi:hypothetical protein
MEQIDQRNISESQVPSPERRPCKYCRTPIHPHATVCQYCRYHQRWLLNNFQPLASFISIILLGVSVWQFMVASDLRTKADNALQRASVVEQVAKQMESLLAFNFLVTKANSDDRKAFDELWGISQTPSHGYQDLAQRAVETLVWSSSTLPKQPALAEKLQLLSHSELLTYYRQTPHVHSASVLLAVNDPQNTRMTEEEKADFTAIMVEEDASFRVAQRACMYIGVEKSRAVKPVLHDRVIEKCKMYGKLWGY